MNCLFSLNEILLLTPFWLAWWFYVIVIAVLSIVAFVMHRVKMSAIKAMNGNLHRELAECSELKHYAIKNEQKALEEAAVANRNKRELLSKISHEIRTPMNAMWGMASLLNETPLSDEQREYSTAILNSGESLITIINDILMQDILQYSKVESGKELESKDFEVCTAIEEVLAVFAAKAAQLGLDLLYHVDEDVPAMITGDAQRLKQILTNLVENAFRFTRKGEIFIGAHNVQTGYDGQMKLEFEVRDTGSGMNPEREKQVAQDLALSESNDSTNYIGVTLLICKRLVSIMGGNIKVKSSENEGTTFRFTIATDKSNKPVQKYLQAEMIAQQGKKVLIADGNITSGKMLKYQLEQWKLSPVVVESGDKALEKLKEDADIRLVLCDHNLLKPEGIKLIEEIKKNYPDLPVILLNKSGDESFRQYLPLFKAIVSKPLRQHLLSKEIFNALNPKGSSEQKPDKLSTDFSSRYPLSILVAEDDKMNQQMVKMVLKKLGYTAEMVSNGKEVLEMVSHNTFDIVLMDVQMPEMDGLEATRMIRLCLDSQPVVIAMTANTLQGDREACLEAGMDDYLSKPVKLAELVRILEKWATQEQRKQGFLAHV